MSIASFTQTYGEERILELRLLKYDRIGNYFRNKCDFIIFSFHNCSDDFIKKGVAILGSIYQQNKLLILKCNYIDYVDCIRKMLENVKSKNVKYVLQIQDDQFGINNKKVYDNLHEIDDIFTFLSTYKPDFLHLYTAEGDKDKNGVTPLSEKTIGNTVFYEYDSRDFKDKNIWGWNDGTYFGEVNFLIELFRNTEYKDVWWVEWGIKELFHSKKYIRWGTNKLYFSSSNIHGRNAANGPIKDILSYYFRELPEIDEINQVINECS